MLSAILFLLALYHGLAILLWKSDQSLSIANHLTDDWHHGRKWKTKLIKLYIKLSFPRSSSSPSPIALCLIPRWCLVRMINFLFHLRGGGNGAGRTWRQKGFQQGREKDTDEHRYKHLIKQSHHQSRPSCSFSPITYDLSVSTASLSEDYNLIWLICIILSIWCKTPF